jgi:AraC-like DNA-binding protein
MKILARHLSTFIEYAQVRGIPQEEVWKLTDTSIMNLKEQTATITVDDFYKILSYIEKRLNDHMLGLRVGEYLNLSALGLVYQISLQAATIEEGLLYLKSFLDATFPIIRMETVLKEEEARITLKIDKGEELLNRIMLESTLTIVYRELCMMAGGALPYACVFSPFYQPFYPHYWSKGEEFSLSCQPFVLKTAIADKSRLHLDVLVPEYMKLIERITAGKTFSSQVKIAALHMARPELPGLEQVADIFNLTPRTLQRRLNGEKCTFRGLTDELKKQISYLLIHHKRFSVADVGYVLGYAEPAAFIHSFKKWYGQSPQKFRQQLNP